MNDPETTLDASTFSMMQAFIEHLEPEVGGRGMNLTDEESGLLARFAQGDLSQAEREALMPLLSENPEAVALLAQLAK